MHVNVNSDNHIDLKESAVQHWQTEIETGLERFADWVTRVEVHLTDENSRAKGGSDDIRCLMEARPANQQPVSIEVRSGSVEQAVYDAINTLERRLGGIADKARTQARKRRGPADTE